MHIYSKSLKSACCSIYAYLVGILVLLLTINPVLEAQSFYRYQQAGQLNLYAGSGLTKYFGELSDEKKLGDINPYLTVGVNIPLQSRWSLRPEISYYRISAADSDLPAGDSRRSRNLSFRSNNLELSGLIVYGLHAKDQRLKISRLKPYVMVGLGLSYFNPKARLNGSWHLLPPLKTEGVKYQKFHIVVPAGFGMAVVVTDQWQVGIEMGYRFSFTDYLDDVSNEYQDPASFSDPIAASLADRGPEIGLEKVPAGTPRGNAKTNDGYLFFGVKVFHQLSGSGPLRRKR